MEEIKDAETRRGKRWTLGGQDGIRILIQTILPGLQEGKRFSFRFGGRPKDFQRGGGSKTHS